MGAYLASAGALNLPPAYSRCQPCVQQFRLKLPEFVLWQVQVTECSWNPVPCADQSDVRTSGVSGWSRTLSLIILSIPRSIASAAVFLSFLNTSFS